MPTDLDPYYPPKTEEIDKISGEHIPFITATVQRINKTYHDFQERKKRAAEKKDAKRAANAEKKAAKSTGFREEKATDTKSDDGDRS